MVRIKRRIKINKRYAKKERGVKKDIPVSKNYQYDILPEDVDGMDYYVWFW